VTPPRHAVARPRDNWRGPRSGEEAVYAQPSPEGRVCGGGRLAGRRQPARPARTRRGRPSAARLPSGRRPQALAGATRPAAGGRATDARGGAQPSPPGEWEEKRKSPRPDARIKWRGSRRRQRGGGLLCRSGGPGSLSSLRVLRNGRPGQGTEAGAPIPAEQQGNAVRLDLLFSVRLSGSPFRPVVPSPCPSLAWLDHGEKTGEPEGIVFPRRGPGVKPRWQSFEYCPCG